MVAHGPGIKPGQIVDEAALPSNTEIHAALIDIGDDAASECIDNEFNLPARDALDAHRQFKAHPSLLEPADEDAVDVQIQAACVTGTADASVAVPTRGVEQR